MYAKEVRGGLVVLSARWTSNVMPTSKLSYGDDHFESKR